MTSDGKVLYTEVVHIVETVNFAFGVIIVRGSIRPAELLQDSDCSENCIIESDPHLKIGPKSHEDGLKRRSGSRCLMWIIGADKFDVDIDSIRTRSTTEIWGQIRVESKLD